MLCLVTQSCPTLVNPGSSIHGILQARILEWVAIPFSRGLSQPRDQTQVSRTAGRFFTVLIGDSVLFILSFCDFCLKKIDAFLDESGATQMLRSVEVGLQGLTRCAYGQTARHPTSIRYQGNSVTDPFSGRDRTLTQSVCLPIFM